VLTATCPSDFTATPRGRPYNAVTQLREIPACKSSFLKVHLARGVTTWVPTHASQLLVTRHGSVSAFLSYHAHGSPLGLALSWVVSVPGILQRWRGYFTSQVTPYWYWDYGLEATFLSITVMRYGGPRPPCPYRDLLLCRPLHGLPYLWVSGGDINDGSTWRRLNMATPTPGDARTWRCPHLVSAKWSTY